MRVDFIDPFVDAALGVLGAVLDTPVSKGRITLAKGLKPGEGFSVSFALTGDIEGLVVFDTSEKSAMDIAGLMNGREFAEINETVLDSMAELMNMVVGRSVTILNDKGYMFRLAPPLIICGKEMKMSSHDLETLVVPVRSSYGDLLISVSMRAG